MTTPSFPTRRSKLSPARRLALFIVIMLALAVALSKNNDVNASASSLLTGTWAASSSSRLVETEDAILTRLFQNADAKIAERRDWITRDSEKKFFGNLTKAELWYLFPPFLPCYWTFEKDPGVVKAHDGGKWLCGIQEVHESRQSPSGEYGVGKHYEAQPCIVYSMGSCDKFDFEERVRKLAPGCEIHTFDPTKAETGKGKPYYDSYHGDFGFGGTDSSIKGRFPVKSLATIMKELEHTHVDYLKIDVEGYEWPFFDDVDWNTVRVGHLLMELHPSTTGLNFFGRDPNAVEMNEIFNKLERAGFYLISVEPVTFTNFGQVEVVFIHKDWRPRGWQSPPSPKTMRR